MIQVVLRNIPKILEVTGILITLISSGNDLVNTLLDNRSKNDIISSGETKHDHRSNCGDDRTPAQKRGDKKRKKY